MAQTRPAKRPASAAPGVKALITAAALAGTLSGWALFTLKQEAAALMAPPTSVVLQLPPMPTLIARSAAAGVAPVAQAAAAPAPALRRVSAQAFSSAPAPVTVTRSSR
ncbi:MAG: hypothetical protein MUO38_02795 [Anaerolineales bacterium]|nr:hypothetical protein [Anaerolineales bacterium]